MPSIKSLSVARPTCVGSIIDPPSPIPEVPENENYKLLSTTFEEVEDECYDSDEDYFSRPKTSGKK